MNRLGVSDSEAKEYMERAKEEIKKAIERRAAIERRGGVYKGELKLAIEDINACEAMLKLIQDNS